MSDRLELIAIGREGQVDIRQAMPEAAVGVLESMAGLYASRGFQPPWIGYLARSGGEVVGTCAFTSAPVDGRVEIAYYCFAEYEGRGIATAMAKQLLAIAHAEDAGILVFAHTLPEENASTAILRKLGFASISEIIHPEDGRIWLWERG